MSAGSKADLGKQKDRLAAVSDIGTAKNFRLSPAAATGDLHRVHDFELDVPCQSRNRNAASQQAFLLKKKEDDNVQESRHSGTHGSAWIGRQTCRNRRP